MPAATRSTTHLLNKFALISIDVRARKAGGGAAAPDLGKTIIFRAKAKFFGQKPVAKEMFFFVFIKRKNGIHSV